MLGSMLSVSIVLNNLIHSIIRFREKVHVRVNSGNSILFIEGWDNVNSINFWGLIEPSIKWGTIIWFMALLSQEIRRNFATNIHLKTFCVCRKQMKIWNCKNSMSSLSIKKAISVKANMLKCVLFGFIIRCNFTLCLLVEMSGQRT